MLDSEVMSRRLLWLLLLIPLLLLAGYLMKPHMVTLTWRPSISRVVAYRIYRREIPENKRIFLNVVNANTTEYKDHAVRAGHTYEYTVSAVDADNKESQPSLPISATIPRW